MKIEKEQLYKIQTYFKKHKLKCPKIRIVKRDNVFNAKAELDGSITVTSGLWKKTTFKEKTAIFAHEINHIKAKFAYVLYFLFY
ncbi:MAG: M48 family metalloprotease [Candidatus Aenigmatarchaeota archaeon]